MISVVMPAYNAEQYIREAIDSILSQTYRDFEFIIINDGSSDGTKGIINSYSDSRIVYLENEINAGICVTLNRGLDAARGKYIIRMDSDDISLPKRFAEQVGFMEQHREIVVAGSLVERMFEDSSLNEFPPSEYDSMQCKADMLFSTCMAHPAVIIRRSILEANCLRYEDYYRGMEDYYLWWQLSLYGNVSNIQKVLLKYRIHKSQVTQKPLTDQFIAKIRQFTSKRLEDIGVKVNDDEIDAVVKYQVAFSTFDDSSLESLIQCLSKVLRHIKSNKSYYRAQQLTVARAISYSYDMSAHNMKRSNLYYMRRSLKYSAMPYMWFLKRVCHILFT